MKNETIGKRKRYVAVCAL